MKKILLLSLVSVCAMSAMAQTTREYYTAYIEKYYKQAQAEQKKHGIPASITLAQGLLESGAGRSELATKANNHFGVKCAGGWTGETFLKDDDQKDDCFRKYKHATQSYEDHSQFLLKPRYESLFKLQQTDYKGWAHGLKRCGYATDPGYAAKLIKLIEDYNLMQYDVEGKTAQKTTTASAATSTQTKTATNKTGDKKKSVVVQEDWDSDEAEEVVERSFKQRKSGKSMAAVDLVAEHKVRSNNGSRYVVARQGDTFESLAHEFNIYEKTLRRFNDIVNPRYELQEGDKVYLYAKRRKAKRQYAVYRVRRDENIWQIAQDKGMRLKTIYRLNGITEGQNVTINQELKLR